MEQLTTTTSTGPQSKPYYNPRDYTGNLDRKNKDTAQVRDALAEIDDLTRRLDAMTELVSFLWANWKNENISPPVEDDDESRIRATRQEER